MRKKLRVGDKVKVVGMWLVTFPLGAKDDLGTEKLFKSMLGKVYTAKDSTILSVSSIGGVKSRPVCSRSV
jgi:hypothetical protein